MTLEELRSNHITSAASSLAIVVALVPVLAAATAAPAAAAQRDRPVYAAVTAMSCSAQGGVYARTSTGRTCTTVTTQTVDGPETSKQVTVFRTSWPGGGAEHSLIGTASERRTTVTTVVQGQARRAMTVSRTAQEWSVTVPVSCVERVEQTQPGFRRPDGTWVEGTRTVADTAMPVERCQAAGLYP